MGGSAQAGTLVPGCDADQGYGSENRFRTSDRSALTSREGRPSARPDLHGDQTASRSSRGAQRVMSTPGFSGSGRRRSGGLTPWLKATFSVLGSAVAMFAVGAFCALTYPILRDLRAERLRGENGTEERILGFWSILMISTGAGCISCVFSWTLTQLDSYQPGMAFPSLLSLLAFRDPSSHGFNVTSGLAVLNGILAMLTLIWSLS